MPTGETALALRDSTSRKVEGGSLQTVDSGHGKNRPVPQTLVACEDRVDEAFERMHAGTPLGMRTVEGLGPRRPRPTN